MLRRSLSFFLVALAASASACLDGDAQVASGDLLVPPADTISDDASAADARPAEDTVVAPDTAPPDTFAHDVMAPDTVAPDTVEPAGLAITGRLYDDRNDIARSAHAHAPNPVSGPLPAITVRLASPGLAPGAPVWRTTQTDVDGRFTFNDLAPGPHIVLPDIPAGSRCTSNNLPRSIAAALDRGSMTILTFGDSVPHWGPTPWFPARLATLLGPLIPVTDINVAEPGSTSREWHPTSGFRFSDLDPYLDDADVVVFSLGGNDVTFAFSELVDADPDEILANLGTYLDMLDDEIDAVEANLRAIIGAIRARNANADIVWFVYPNYAWNNYWAPYLGQFADLARSLLADRLDDFRFRMSRIDGLLLADMYGAIDGPDVAPLMVDELHLNAVGHARYAREVLSVLGGVDVGADAGSSFGLERAWGFHFATAP
jgi:lysophospholipase L1-like esterase